MTTKVPRGSFGCVDGVIDGDVARRNCRAITCSRCVEYSDRNDARLHGVTDGKRPDVHRNCMNPGGKSKADYRFRRNRQFTTDAINSEAITQLRQSNFRFSRRKRERERIVGLTARNSGLRPTAVFGQWQLL